MVYIKTSRLDKYAWQFIQFRDQPKQERQSQGNLTSIFYVVMTNLNKKVNVGPGTLMFT